MSSKKTTSPTPVLDELIQSSPDLVDRIFEFVVELCPEISPERVAELKSAAREEFRGERCYVNEQSPTERQQRVAEMLALFNGRNATELARRFNISRATVYRYIKQSGGKPVA